MRPGESDVLLVGRSIDVQEGTQCEALTGRRPPSHDLPAILGPRHTLGRHPRALQVQVPPLPVLELLGDDTVGPLRHRSLNIPMAFGEDLACLPGNNAVDHQGPLTALPEDVPLPVDIAQDFQRPGRRKVTLLLRRVQQPGIAVEASRSGAVEGYEHAVL